MIPKTGTRELPPGVEDVRATLTDVYLVKLQEQVVTHGDMSINDKTLILALIAEIEDGRGVHTSRDGGRAGAIP